MVEIVDENSHNKDDLNNPNRDSCHRHDIQRSGKCFNNNRYAPAVVFSGKIHKTRKCKGKDTAEEQENLEIFFDLSVEKGRIRTAQKMMKRPRITKISMPMLLKDAILY